MMTEMLDILHDEYWREKFNSSDHIRKIEELRDAVKILGELDVVFKGGEYFIDRYYVFNVKSQTNECEFSNIDEFMKKGTIGGVPLSEAVRDIEITYAPG